MTELTIVVIGGAGVGKTSLTVSLTTGKFSTEYNPTIEDQYNKELKIEGEKYILNILDTAGQEEYSVLRDQYWRMGDGFIIVYDITSKKSFEEVNTFYETIKKSLETESFHVVLCGNKTDLDHSREVPKEEASNYAKSKGWSFYETSAKTNVNVEVAFETLVKNVASTKKKKGESEKKEEKKEAPKKKGILGWFK